MSRLTWSLGVLSVLFLVARSVAGEPCAGSLGRELQCTRCATVPCCCPDDYCRKPMPCAPCLRMSWCADDYCPKPMPCIPCLRFCWCPDDYCRKPMPRLCWPVAGQFYRCAPGSDQASVSGVR